MKKLIKKYGILAMIVVIICISIITIITIINKSEGVGNAGISKEEYESIKSGMTMTQVSQIINSENMNNVVSEQISRIEEKSGTTVYKYKYTGEHKGYAIVTYEYTFDDLWSGSGMKVILKEQFNLK